MTFETKNQQYLSFDCATKTFAYVLCEIKFEYFNSIQNQLNEIFKAINEKMIFMIGKLKSKNITEHKKCYPEITQCINLIDECSKLLKQFITISHANTIDLIPNQKDTETSTTERVLALSKFAKTDIIPLLNLNAKLPLTILVEFQMGTNPKAKVILSALIAILYYHDPTLNIYIVSPALKNTISLADYPTNYKSAWSANKAHARNNFEIYQCLYDINVDMKKSLIGHVADSFFQVIGFIRNKESASKHRY